MFKLCHYSHYKLLRDSSDDAADGCPTQEDENKYKIIPLMPKRAT